jgi:hypothetical protein
VGVCSAAVFLQEKKTAACSCDAFGFQVIEGQTVALDKGESSAGSHQSGQTQHATGPTGATAHGR